MLLMVFVSEFVFRAEVSPLRIDQRDQFRHRSSEGERLLPLDHEVEEAVLRRDLAIEQQNIHFIVSIINVFTKGR
jgi:hypothetical protein